MPTATRRTQQERTAQTRGKLLEAAIASLAEVGYGQTTTRRVAELAGVSAGAMTHHFPRRVDLIGAAIERLAEQNLAELAAKVAALGDGEDALRQTLDLMWDLFSTEVFTVFVKVWVAAAEDPELHERIVPTERMLVRTIRRDLEALLGPDALTPEFEAAFNTVLATLRGHALVVRFEPRARPGKDRWPEVREHLLKMLRG